MFTRVVTPCTTVRWCRRFGETYGVHFHGCRTTPSLSPARLIHFVCPTLSQPPLPPPPAFFTAVKVFAWTFQSSATGYGARHLLIKLWFIGQSEICILRRRGNVPSSRAEGRRAGLLECSAKHVPWSNLLVVLGGRAEFSLGSWGPPAWATQDPLLPWKQRAYSPRLTPHLSFLL
jgi:hypothetical protein